MFARLKPLDQEKDRNLRLSPGPDIGAFATQMSVPVVAAEFPVLCRNHVLAFADGAEPQPVAILGMRQGGNRYAAPDGAWATGERDAIPAFVRQFPFVFAPPQGGGEELLCYDADWAFADPADAEPVGDDAGFSPSFQRRVAAARLLVEGRAESRALVGFLKEYDLLVERVAHLRPDQGEAARIRGFSVVDMEQLARIPAQALKKAAGRGWLLLISAHHISLQNFARLLPANDGNAP